ncbi:MAG: hypothetical protein WCF85_03975 [Rhodospirillaceae bacterium]
MNNNRHGIGAAEDTRRAMELLTEAVVREMRPGVLELRLAARMLRDALDDPTPGALALATRAFNAIDADTRRRIHDSALLAAIGADALNNWGKQ